MPDPPDTVVCLRVGVSVGFCWAPCVLGLDNMVHKPLEESTANLSLPLPLHVSISLLILIPSKRDLNNLTLCDKEER